MGGKKGFKGLLKGWCLTGSSEHFTECWDCQGHLTLRFTENSQKKKKNIQCVAVCVTTMPH